MTKVSIVTHTGCDMSPGEVRELSARMVSDFVVFSDKTYRNMVDLTPPEFYDRIKDASTITSSHFSAGEMLEAMVEASDDAEEVLCLALTKKMSGCYAAAVVASQLFKTRNPGRKVYVYDTTQVSHGMAIMVREAARMAEDGMSAAEIMAALDELKGKIGVYFVLDSLKYAKKGGRVGAIKMLAADILGIKPLMVFQNGEVRDIGVTRNMNEGLAAVLEKAQAELDPTYEVTVFHADCLERANELAEMIKKIYPEARIRIEYVGPVIGIFAGPGTVGVAFTKKNGC